MSATSIRRGTWTISLFTLASLFAAPLCAQQSLTFSPLTAIGVGPSGPASSKIIVEPHCCPSTAISVRSSTTVSDGDLQWVLLGLQLPVPGLFDFPIAGVEVCYEIKAATAGASYISQTRLTEMTTPDKALVRLDDATDHKEAGPGCYQAKASFSPEGTVTLALKIVLGATGDEIRVGMVKLHLGEIGFAAAENCPDPAARAIDFDILSRSSRFAGKVRITGTITNIGTQNFASGEGQQAVYLYEVVPGGAPAIVAQHDFQNLEAGVSARVVHERDWMASSPAEGEFPPLYRLTILYDPDIAIDGNENNDDCDLGNNQLERSGADISGMFTGGGD